jgi:hypothetical protein
VEAAAAEKEAAAAEAAAVRAELRALKDKNAALLDTQKRAAAREEAMDAEEQEREKELTAVYDQVSGGEETPRASRVTTGRREKGCSRCRQPPWRVGECAWSREVN